MRNAFKIVALGLLAVIALDIPDAACDPVEFAADRPGISTSFGHEADPCSESCVPDCFCCSSTLLAVPVSANGSLELLPDLPGVVPLRLTQGSPALQDHVPRIPL